MSSADADRVLAALGVAGQRVAVGDRDLVLALHPGDVLEQAAVDALARRARDGDDPALALDRLDADRAALRARCRCSCPRAGGWPGVGRASGSVRFSQLFGLVSFLSSRPVSLPLPQLTRVAHAVARVDRVVAVAAVELVLAGCRRRSCRCRPCRSGRRRPRRRRSSPCRRRRSAGWGRRCRRSCRRPRRRARPRRPRRPCRSRRPRRRRPAPLSETLDGARARASSRPCPRRRRRSACRRRRRRRARRRRRRRRSCCGRSSRPAGRRRCRRARSRRRRRPRRSRRARRRPASPSSATATAVPRSV